ncbi:hypothetical protein ACVWWG_001137 [Bradyrhizobium sp. LB7.2]
MWARLVPSYPPFMAETVLPLGSTVVFEAAA